MARDLLESVKIVALCTLAAVVYGVIHDQVTARVCLEYFTVAHPDVAGHDPTIIGLHWGVVATWWVGLPLGVALAIASRAGPYPVATAVDAVPRVAKLLVILFTLAMSAGCVAYVGATLGWVELGGRLGDAVPAAHHAAFLFDAWAHTTSYVAGALGGAWVTRATSWQRSRAAPARDRRAAPPPR